MTTYSRPGVFIQEIELPSTIVLADNGSAVGALVGTLGQGKTDIPVLLTSWIDFVKTFGKLDDAYPTTWAAYNFFANGGRNLYVKRVVGADAASATVSLTDRSGGGGINTLSVTAISSGTWGNGLAVAITAAGDPTRFNLTVTSAAGVSQTYADLSMDIADSRYVVSAVNSVAERYVNVVDLLNGSTVPSNMPALTTLGVVSLTGGVNGDAPLEADYLAAYGTFDPIQNPLVMNVPDAAYASDSSYSQTIQSDLASYCEARGDAFAVLDVKSGLSVSDAKTFITAALGAATGEYAAAYYPWIQIPNSLRATPGAVRLQAPGAAMIGQYLATDASRGVFKSPAGINNRLALAVATERLLSNSELDDINTTANPLNAIRQVPGAGIVPMGARTLQNTPQHRYINVRRSLIYIKNEMTNRSTFAVFENNDERLWSRIRTALGAFLESYWQQGGLRGTSPKDAFFVRVDSTTTSFSDMQNGIVNIEVGVALEYPAEFVVIKLGQLTGNATA